MDRADKTRGFTPFGSLQATARLGNTSIGIKADVFSINAKRGLDVGGLSTGQPHIQSFAVYNVYAPALNISALVNQSFTLGKYAMYYGAQAGYIFSTRMKLDYEDQPGSTSLPGVSERIRSKKTDGITLGIQAGCSRKLTKHVYVKAETAPRYLFSMHVTGFEDRGNYNTIIIPVSFGIGYTI
ncbi:MAG: hypothetical protein EOP49_24045 [Sphingobacteriales bacterium]|nr:MAG: hypothetical protein EOP49_24045 [Sphingobacteriales bacterium]